MVLQYCAWLSSEADKELFTGSSDSTARSWNVETEHVLRVFEGHQAPFTG